MVKAFEEGEVYRCAKLDHDIMVYAIAEDTPEKVVMAIGKIDRVSEEMTGPGDITVNKADFGDWEVVEV